MKQAPADWHHARRLCLLLVLVTLLVYCRSGEFGFTNYDDPEYVTDNSYVAQGLTWAGIAWAFTTTAAGNWHPLTWLSHMLDVQLFGMNAGWHHLTNLLLHIGNVLLLFLVLRKLSGALWQSAFVSAMFAWHPLHVESVAWIAERKDVLSTLFGLGCLWAYASYAQAQSVTKGSARLEHNTEAKMCALSKPRPWMPYALALFWFSLSLMSKPMLVTVPVLLLALDYWPLGRGRSSGSWFRLLLEKVPFMVLSLGACAITFIAQKGGGAVASVVDLPVAARIEGALVSYVTYLAKCFAPTGLAVFYPHPGRWPAGDVIQAAALLVVITTVTVWLRRRNPWLGVGWAWYLVTLVPVIGLLQVGMQSHADRYTYLPLTGIFIILAWGSSDLIARRPHLVPVLRVAALLSLLACSVAAYRQLSLWRNSEILFDHAIAVTANNFAAYNNRGVARFERGKTNEALADFQEAARLRPDSASTLTSLGMAMGARGQTNEAVKYYQAALQVDPRFPQAHYDLGLLEFAAGNRPKAIQHFEAALASRPDFADAHYNLAAALESEGSLAVAVAHYRHALKLKPDDLETLNNLGAALARQGKLSEALFLFEQLLRRQPRFAQGHYNLAETLLQKGMFKEALQEYRLALRYRPDWAEGHNNVAWLLATHSQSAMRHGSESLELAKKACRLRGPDVSYLQTLAAAYAECGQFTEAINTAQQAYDLAVSTGQTFWTNTAKQRIGLYAAGRPLRQP